MTFSSARKLRTIKDLADLLAYFGADSAQGLNRRIYKDTACGASISVQTPDGAWHHNGRDWGGITAIQAFTVQTIVEGSDATVDSEIFALPVKVRDLDKWIDTMEAEADRLWHEANEEEEEEEELC